MIGSAISMLGYYALTFVFSVWMLVKIARSSVILAIASFFFWPAALIALIRNWGDPEHDIRLPFFATAATAALAMFMAYRTVDKLFEEGAVYMSDADIAMIAEDDPELAAELRERRDAARASPEFADVDWDDFDWDEIEEDDRLGELKRELSKRRQAHAPNPALVLTPRIDRRAATPLRRYAEPTGDEQALQQAVGQLAFRVGNVTFEQAHARVQLPRGFRWIPRFALPQIAAMRGTPIEPASLGWAVHEKVDLADPAAWYVELLFVESGHMPLPAAGSDYQALLDRHAGAALADGSGRMLGDGNYRPTWIADSGVLTWAVLDDPFSLDPGADLVAAKPLRHGVLLFVMHDLADSQHELGLRATRLFAANTHVEPLWSHDQFRRDQDQLAAQPLFEWILGAPAAAASGP